MESLSVEVKKAGQVGDGSPSPKNFLQPESERTNDFQVRNVIIKKSSQPGQDLKQMPKPQEENKDEFAENIRNALAAERDGRADKSLPIEAHPRKSFIYRSNSGARNGIKKLEP